MKTDRARFSRRCNRRCNERDSHSSYTSHPENSISPPNARIDSDTASRKRHRCTSQRRAVHDGERFTYAPFAREPFRSFVRFARVRIWLINQNHRRWETGVERRRKREHRFAPRIRWILLFATKNMFACIFHIIVRDYFEPIFFRRIRGISDWYFCYRPYRRNFRFSRKDGHAGWLFFERALWPNVNFQNLCRCVSFGLVENSVRRRS